MKPEWPIVAAERADPPAADDRQPLLPLALSEHVELIKGGAALDAFARKRASQIVTHGHTPEADLQRPIAALANEAKYRLTAITEVLGRNRMNLPPERREQCMRYIEIAGGILISLWDRCQVEVDEQ